MAWALGWRCLERPVLQTQSARGSGRGGSRKGKQLPMECTQSKTILSILPPPEHMVLSEELVMGQLSDTYLSSLELMPDINNGRQGLIQSHKIPGHRFVVTEITPSRFQHLAFIFATKSHATPSPPFLCLETHLRQELLSPVESSLGFKECNYESKPSSPGTKVSPIHAGGWEPGPVGQRNGRALKPLWLPPGIS